MKQEYSSTQVHPAEFGRLVAFAALEGNFSVPRNDFTLSMPNGTVYSPSVECTDKGIVVKVFAKGSRYDSNLLEFKDNSLIFTYRINSKEGKYEYYPCHQTDDLRSVLYNVYRVGRRQGYEDILISASIMSELLPVVMGKSGR